MLHYMTLWEEKYKATQNERYKEMGRRQVAKMYLQGKISMTGLVRLLIDIARW